MKIIIHRYGSICEPDIIEAFQACNITVIEDSAEIRQKSISSETRISVLGKLVLTHRPVFVFSINFFPYISEICERLGVLYVSLSVDCPVLNCSPVLSKTGATAFSCLTTCSIKNFILKILRGFFIFL